MTEPNNSTTADMNNQSISNNNNTSSTHNNNSISIQRNQSISSTTSTKSTHDGAPQHLPSQPTSSTTTSTFPTSPAFSTLTKNTSSSDSCSSAHIHSSAYGRMNVDDILNKSKFKGVKKRRGRKSTVGVAVRNSVSGVNNGSVNDGMRVNNKSAAKKPIGVPSNNYHQKVRAHSSTTGRTNTNKQDNGQNERKMRLQQEQLIQQKKLLSKSKGGLGSSISSSNKRVGKGNGVLKRQSSLDSRTSLDREMENTQNIGDLGMERLRDDRSTTSRSSSSSKRARQLALEKEISSTSGSNKSDPTQQRRSKRAKLSIPPSYNVTELIKQNSIISEIEVKKASSVAVGNQTIQHEKIESAERLQSKEELADGMEKGKNKLQENEPEEEEEEEPDSVQSALSTLLIKYNSCIAIPSPTTSLPSSSTKTLTSTKVSTTWEIVQLLVSTLRYINLLDPKSVNTEEYKDVVNGLSNVIKSVSCVKLMVMNRGSIIQIGGVGAKGGNGNNEQRGNVDNQDDEEDSTTKLTNYNSKLLSNIQLQIWMRMMIWSLEEVAGWEFLCKIVLLADDKLKQDGMDDGGGDNKGGKGKKKKKGKKQQKKTSESNDMSPRDSLVQDIRQLMELAPYVLPPSMEFAQWMKDILTLGFRQSIPEYGVELFDHFEIELAEPIALKRSDTDTSRRSERSHVSHSPVKDDTTTKGGVIGSSSTSPTKNITEKRHKRQQAYFASLAEEENKAWTASSSSIKTDDETATITGSVSTVTSTSRASSKSVREKDDNILLKTSVSLTSTIPSRTSNPFLKGSARGSYVGSHLSSKLSNITSLFREVKAAPTKPKAAVPQASKKAAPPQQQAAAAGVKRKNSLPKQLSVTSVKAPATTTRFKKTITEESAVSSVPNQPQSNKRRRPAVSSLRASSYTAASTTTNPRLAASSSFTVGETPMKRPIIEETPAKKPQPGAARQRLRLRDDHPYMGNAIVAETPQQPLMRGGSSSSGVDQDSSVLPTNLWSRQYQQQHSGTRRPSQQAGWIDTRHRQQQNGNNSHLSPVVNQFSLGASGPMNLGFSPMPHQEDMASVLAKAAKSAASRKRK